MSGVSGLVQDKHRDRESLYGNEPISGAWGKGQVSFASHSTKPVKLSISFLTMSFMPQRWVGPINLASTCNDVLHFPHGSVQTHQH